MVELRQVRLWYLSLTSISLKTILHTNFESVLSQKKKKNQTEGQLCSKFRYTGLQGPGDVIKFLDRFNEIFGVRSASSKTDFCSVGNTVPWLGVENYCQNAFGKTSSDNQVT